MVRIFCALILTLCCATATAVAKNVTKAQRADTTRVLRGGEKGTVFESLTVEAEDRIQIDFSRPVLDIALDPRSAPGLEMVDALEILHREQVAPVSYIVGATSSAEPDHHAAPWIQRFATGTIARFRPAVEGVERWEMNVTDSRGETVANFRGSGEPPDEIGWDGRTIAGEPAAPGLTYSYSLEAFDEAGNKRNFPGPGFELPAYRVQTVEGTAMLFSGNQLNGTRPAPILREAASWINHATRPGTDITITVTARSRDEANALADRVIGDMQPLLLANPKLVTRVVRAERDAPDSGTVSIAAGGALRRSE